MTRAANTDLPARILAEAERVIIASGYQGINMRRLAGKVGVSAIDPRLPPREFLAELGRQYLGYAQENPNLYRLLFEAAVAADTKGRHRIALSRSLLLDHRISFLTRASPGCTVNVCKQGDGPKILFDALFPSIQFIDRTYVEVQDSLISET